MPPGKVFLLIVREKDQDIDTGPGKSVPTNELFSNTLELEWNLIGSPFSFPIPLSNVFTQSGTRVDFRSYDGVWESLAASDSLKPFEGYAVFNAAGKEDILFINPDLTTPTLSAAKAAARGSEDLLWSIRILARSQQARDIDNVAGVSAKASDQWDGFDRPEPPGIGDYVSVYFPHPEWKNKASRYSTDVRSEPDDGLAWLFEVTTTVHDKVHLTFEGLAEVPPEFEVWLVDDLVQVSQNLRQTNTYVVAGSVAPRSLKLVVGNRAFMENEPDASPELPMRFELFPNFPNPFNPSTTIRYGLPVAARVSLIIYNVLGEKVATLEANAEKQAGYHVVVWDGRSNAGILVASGVYFVRMRAGLFMQTQQMALVK